MLRPAMPTVHVEGATVAYAVRGEGPPVLLVQGTGVAGRAWAPQVDALAGAYQTCCVDNRGVGASTGVPESVEQMAADAVAVMDALGWSDAHVVGHSLGGSIAQAIALGHRDRVRSLNLMCSVPRGSRVLRFDLRALWLQIRCQLGTRAMRREAFFRLVSPRALWAQASVRIPELEDAFGRDLARPPAVTMAQLSALRRYDPGPALGELASLPCCVMAATEDPIAPPSEGRVLARALGTELIELSGSHAVVVQDAEAVNARLLSFLETVDAESAPLRSGV